MVMIGSKKGVRTSSDEARGELKQWPTITETGQTLNIIKQEINKRTWEPLGDVCEGVLQ